MEAEKKVEEKFGNKRGGKKGNRGREQMGGGEGENLEKLVAMPTGHAEK